MRTLSEQQFKELASRTGDIVISIYTPTSKQSTDSYQTDKTHFKNKIKEKVQNDMKEKHAEPERQKGKKALEDITYENDTRHPVPENPVQATLVMEMKSYKKNGKLDDAITSKLVFGKTGECIIMNEGEKNETRMLYDYKGAATYMVNEKERTAIKMPMINFQKMIEGMAKSGFNSESTDAGTWERTNEQKEINGFMCQKYIYTNPEEKTKMDIWTTQDITIDLSGNHMMGGQIKDFSKMMEVEAVSNPNLPKGMMVRSVQYEKNRETPSSQMDILTFNKSSDPAYFDLSKYTVTDIMGKL